MGRLVVKTGIAVAGAALALLGAEEAANAEDISGTPGDDILDGTVGDDVIDAGDGDDEAYGGTGDDVVSGGAGDDFLSEYRGAAEGLESESGDDVYDGGPGDDFIETSGGDDVIFGGEGDDDIYGDPGDDVIDAGPGDDYAEGEEGHDVVIGGPGADDLAGDEFSNPSEFDPDEDGHDVVCGDAEDLTVVGGNGVDLPCGVATANGVSGGGQLDARDRAPISGTVTIERMLDDDGVTGSDDLVEGPILHLVTTSPTKGTLVVDEATGAFTYTPSADAFGVDWFEISLARRIQDGSLGDALPSHLVFDGTATYIQWGSGLFEVLLPAAEVVPLAADPTVIQLRESGLPVTGGATGPLAALGSVLIGLGTAMHLGARRYRGRHLRS